MSGQQPTEALACPLCASDDYTPVKAFTDGVVVGRCRTCGMLYTPRRHAAPHTVLAPATLDDLHTAYEEVISGRRPHYRRSNYLAYLAILGRHARGRRLLDVGCAHGFFGREAQRTGYVVAGVEPHPGMADFAREVNGLDVFVGRLEDVDLGGRVFDVVTFTDSLEYVPDPLAALSGLRGHVVPGGVFFLKVPNARNSLLRARLERRGGGAFGPSRRVCHFTRETLAALVAKAGLERVEDGATLPVHSPTRRRQQGGWSEVAPSWHEGFAGRVVRRSLDLAGRVEGVLTGGRNDLSPAIYVVARKPSGEGEENADAPEDRPAHGPHQVRTLQHDDGDSGRTQAGERSQEP